MLSLGDVGFGELRGLDVDSINVDWLWSNSRTDSPVREGVRGRGSRRCASPASRPCLWCWNRQRACRGTFDWHGSKPCAARTVALCFGHGRVLFLNWARDFPAQVTLTHCCLKMQYAWDSKITHAVALIDSPLPGLGRAVRWTAE